MNPPTVAAFVETRYLAALARRDPEGREARERTLRKHILPAIGRRQLRNVVYRDLQALTRERLAARIPLGTVHAIAAELRALFCYARSKHAYSGPIPLPENFLPNVAGLIREYAGELERLQLDPSRIELLRRMVPASVKAKAVAEISPADLKRLVKMRAAAGAPAPELRSLGRALVGLFDYGRENGLYSDVVPTRFLLAEPRPGAMPGAVVANGGAAATRQGASSVAR